LFSLFFWVEIRFSLLRQFAWLFWSISNPIILLLLLLLLLLLSDGVFLTWLRGNKRELERDTPAIIVRGGSRGGEQVLSCVIHLPLVSLLYNTADAYKCTWEREREAHTWPTGLPSSLSPPPSTEKHSLADYSNIWWKCCCV
jgi:hypothetical protein